MYAHKDNPNWINVEGSFLILGSDRGDLQIIQNNILRTCYNVKLLDRLSLVEMHREAVHVSLEQRRIVQLLDLMYNI